MGQVGQIRPCTHREQHTMSQNTHRLGGDLRLTWLKTAGYQSKVIYTVTVH